MMLLGLLWAMLAPLSLVALVAALTFAARRIYPRAPLVVALGASAILVLSPVAYLWRQDRAAFDALCAAEGPARILDKANADGMLLVSGTSNSFGMRYLHEEGFAWMEARDIHRRDGFVRYTRNDKGEISTTPIEAPTARYEVRETFEEPAPTVSVSRTTVVERQTQRELARASSLMFLGGRLRWLTGAWGVATCPDARSDAAAFNAWYHLARNTLR